MVFICPPLQFIPHEPRKRELIPEMYVRNFTMDIGKIHESIYAVNMHGYNHF